MQKDRKRHNFSVSKLMEECSGHCLAGMKASSMLSCTDSRTDRCLSVVITSPQLPSLLPQTLHSLGCIQNTVYSLRTSQYRRTMIIWSSFSRGPSGWVQSLSCEYRLKDLSSFSLQKRWLKENPTAALSYLQGGY